MKNKIYVISRLYKPLESSIKQRNWEHTGSPAYYNFIKYIQKDRFFDAHLIFLLDSDSAYLYDKPYIKIAGIENKVHIVKYYKFLNSKKKSFLRLELFSNRLLQYLKIYNSVASKKIYYLDRDNMLIYYFLRFKRGVICFRFLGITKKLFSKIFSKNYFYSIYKMPLNNKRNLIISTNDGSWSEIAQNKIKNPNFHVIFNGCDFKPNKLSAFKKPFVFLCISRIEKGKGIKELLFLMKALKDKGFYDFKMVIIGGGSILSEMIQLSMNLELSKHCSFLGEISHKLILKNIKSSNVFFSLNKFGCFGNNVIEATSQGLPIISYKTENIPNKLLNHFLFFEQDNFDNILTEIIKLCSSKEFYNNYSNLSFDFYQNNISTWRKRVEEELDLIKFHLSSS